MVTSSEFLARYPDFTSFPLSIVNAVITVADARCPVDIWGETLRPEGIMLMMAHILETQRTQIAVSASIGNAISSGNQVSPPTWGGEELDLTVYGKLFKTMRKTAIANNTNPNSTVGPAVGFVF